MLRRSVIAASLAVLGGAARAEPADTYPWVLDSPAGGIEFVRQVLPAEASAGELALTRTIYLNRRGATLMPGRNDSQANTSSIVARPTQVRGWNASAADWAATVACMKEMWSRFDVAITDVDPGSTPHIEALFGRAPSDIGLSDNIGGISPFTANCSVVERSIVFAFTDNLAPRPRAICEVMSQEIAHSYGLDHELLASDPMTYLPYSGNRAFQDRDAPCGESTARPCGISGFTCRATQNSIQLLLARLGPNRSDAQERDVDVAEPLDPFALGCSAGSESKITLIALSVFALVRRRRRFAL